MYWPIIESTLAHMSTSRFCQRCHYMTRVGGREDPHPTCTCLILILHGLPSCYTSSYTCRRRRTGQSRMRIFHHGAAPCITLGDLSLLRTRVLPFNWSVLPHYTYLICPLISISLENHFQASTCLSTHENHPTCFRHCTSRMS